MKKRLIAFVLGASILAMISGCQSSTSGTETTAAETNTGTSSASNDTSNGSSAGTDSANTIMGQIEAIDGNSITLALGEMEKGSGQGQGPADSGTAAASGEALTDDADDAEGTKPKLPSGEAPAGAMTGEAPSGEAPSGGGMGGGGNPGGGITLTGEKQTIEVTDSTVITINSQGKTTTGSVSDFTVGSILMVTLSGDTATEITVLSISLG